MRAPRKLKKPDIFKGIEVILLLDQCSYKRLCGRWTSHERGRGQFLQACEPAVLAQLAQELPQLRGRVITQLDFLGGEFGSCAFGEWICGTQDVIEQREGRFNLEGMGGAPAASCLLVELPYPLRWQGFEDHALSGRPGNEP